MRVLLIGGSCEGAVVEVPAQDSSFMRDGTVYTVLFEVFQCHPTRRDFKSAAAFAVPETMLSAALNGTLVLEEELQLVLQQLQAWRWLPG
jgi:hypothetical protein